MNARRTVDLVIIFLGCVTLVGLGGLIWILVLVVGSDKVFDATLLVPLVGITTGALGGMTGLLANTNTSDPDAIAETARAGALADVASLAAPVGAHFVSVVPSPEFDQMVHDAFGPPTTEPVQGPSGFAPDFP